MPLKRFRSHGPSDQRWKQFRRRVFERDGGLCRYCDEPVDPLRYEVDHVEPRAAGGATILSNVVLACPPCNGRGGGTIYRSFAHKREVIRRRRGLDAKTPLAVPGG
jgi:5-methylcytosine-specific restriction endonuclease McrA